jgi:hypothetical protein
MLPVLHDGAGEFAEAYGADGGAAFVVAPPTGISAMPVPPRPRRWWSTCAGPSPESGTVPSRR